MRVPPPASPILIPPHSNPSDGSPPHRLSIQSSLFNLRARIPFAFIPPCRPRRRPPSPSDRARRRDVRPQRYQQPRYLRPLRTTRGISRPRVDLVLLLGQKRRVLLPQRRLGRVQIDRLTPQRAQRQNLERSHAVDGARRRERGPGDGSRSRILRRGRSGPTETKEEEADQTREKEQCRRRHARLSA